MYREFTKKVQSTCSAYFKRKFMHRKSVGRSELSCHTWCSQPDGILSPEEWIDIAQKSGVQVIAITDFQDVEAFWAAAQAAEELRGEADGYEFKVLYGLESTLEGGYPVHLLARNQEGLAQLYHLLEIAWENQDGPFLRKSDINSCRTGLLVGCPGENGELCHGILDCLNDGRLDEIAGFYDYLSILPPWCCGSRFAQKYAPYGAAVGPEELILKTNVVGNRVGKPVVATGNVRIPSQDWGMFRTSVAYGIQKDEGADLNVPLPDLLCTKELLNAFSFLPKELAEEVVIYAPNRLAALCEEIRIYPKDVRYFQPILPDAFQTVAELCQEQLQMRYRGAIPEAMQMRVEYELAILQKNEFLCSVFLISRRLVQGLQESGYPIGTRTYTNSFHAYWYTAYLLGVSAVDPLSAHIPRMAFGEIDKLDLQLSLSVPKECRKECWEKANEIFSQIFSGGTAVSYGRQSNRRLLIPDVAELRNWVPLKKIDGEYMIPYGRIEEFPNTFRLWLCPEQNLSFLYQLGKSTGVSPASVNAEDAVPLLLRDQTDIPGCDKAIWELATPKTMDAIIKTFAVSGSGNWNSMKALAPKKIVSFSEMIGSIDDIFTFLLNAGLDDAFVCQVVEKVQLSEGLDEMCTSVLRGNGVPEWFIHFCDEVWNLFPAAHYAATDAIPALKAAWYKAHFPSEYGYAYSMLYAKQSDRETYKQSKWWFSHLAPYG